MKRKLYAKMCFMSGFNVVRWKKFVWIVSALFYYVEFYVHFGLSCAHNHNTSFHSNFNDFINKLNAELSIAIKSSLSSRVVISKSTLSSRVRRQALTLLFLFLT